MFNTDRVVSGVVRRPTDWEAATPSTENTGLRQTPGHSMYRVTHVRCNIRRAETQYKHVYLFSLLRRL